MKPSLPKGTRDFSAQQLAQRYFITGVLRSHFERFGYRPIETPSLENLSTLTGKYGDEGDRLIFKILNSGDFLKKITPDQLANPDAAEWIPSISEKALRYDLTVPFARYVVMNRGEIEMPFRRYQIQNVWRADRPQKGRFREFMQCDADVVGSDSLLLEVELVVLYDRVFEELGLRGCTIKVNHRKVLMGLASAVGVKPEQLVPFTVALDKLDKVGAENVVGEWRAQGISPNATDRLQPLLQAAAGGESMLDMVRTLLQDQENGRQGLDELDWVLAALGQSELRASRVEFDLTLARGLNYYTGCIFEVAAPDSVRMGSIGGGGRYDDLTGIFGMPGVSGVGISFGLDRIQLVMEEMGVFPADIGTSPDVLVACLRPEDLLANLQLSLRLRESGIKAECFPDPAKLQKQFKYADRKGIPFLLLSGEEEKAREVYQLKNLASGEQKEFSCKKEGLLDALRFLGKPMP